MAQQCIYNKLEQLLAFGSANINPLFNIPISII